MGGEKCTRDMEPERRAEREGRSLTNAKNRRVGRPAKFTAQTLETFFEDLVGVGCVADVCRNSKYPTVSQVFIRLAKDSEFARRYTQAKKHQVERMFNEIIEIADDAAGDILKNGKDKKSHNAAVLRAKLRIDARKWAMAKAMPTVYGDSKHITIDAKVNSEVSDRERAKAILAVLAKSGVKLPMTDTKVDDAPIDAEFEEVKTDYQAGEKTDFDAW